MKSLFTIAIWELFPNFAYFTHVLFKEHILFRLPRRSQCEIIKLNTILSKLCLCWVCLCWVVKRVINEYFVDFESGIRFFITKYFSLYLGSIKHTSNKIAKEQNHDTILYHLLNWTLNVESRLSSRHKLFNWWLTNCQWQ